MKRYMVLLVVGVLAFTIPSDATIINVPGDYSSIQEAINNAITDDTVLVEAGTYNEAVSDAGIDGISLITWENALIIGGSFRGIELTQVSNWLISGFEITGSTNHGIYIEDCTDITVEVCYSHHNTNGYGCHGFGATLCDNVSFYRNISAFNNSDGNCAGIWIWGTTNALLENNTVAFNKTDGIIFSMTGSGCIVKNNISISNGSTGIEFQNENGAFPDPEAVSYNDTWNNGGEDYRGCESYIGGISADPVFVGGDPYNYYLQESSPCIDMGDPDPQYDDPDGTRNDMGALYYHQGPRTWHVSVEGDDVNGDGSEENPFATIRHGIEMASNGDTVLVSPGTYYENINFNGRNIIVASEYLITEDTTYISATIINGNSMGSTVRFQSGENSNAKIIGFTITNGLSGFGGGIYIYSSSPIIEYNHINGNVADNGAGIWCEYSEPLIENNVLLNNDAPGIGHGGAIRVTYGNPSINKNLIINNTANWGGGLYTNNNSISILNNTFYGNVASTRGGGAISNYAELTITNCIFWNNSAPSGPEIDYIGGLPIITYSDIQGGWEGEGNIACDPMFCDPENGNFYLDAASCCVGAGEGGVDIGAFGVGCGQEIPSLSEWGMIVLALLLLAAGTVAVVRRRKAITEGTAFS